MNTAQKNIKNRIVVALHQISCSGFDTFRRRIADQLSMQGCELSEEDDDTLLGFYRRGENETFVLAAFGYEC